MICRVIPADVVFAKLPKHVLEAGDARGRELIEARAPRHVRETVGLMQVAVANAAGTSQDQVSKVERREDLMVSTLEKYIAAMGAPAIRRDPWSLRRSTEP